MPRPPLPLGTWGHIVRTEAPDGRWVARCRFRDFDGRTRKVEAWGRTGAAAERALVSALKDRAAPSDDELTPDTTMARLAVKWLTEVDAGALATNTRQRYREVAEQYVIPGLGAVRVREVTVGRVEAFLRTIGERHGQASARLARTVLSGMFGLAARHDAAPRNIVRDSAAVRVASKEVRALEVSEVRALRAGLRTDKRAVKADVPDVVDAMLATGARIGEILALRWDDVNLADAIPTVTISGTVVRVAGVKDSQFRTTPNRPAAADASALPRRDPSAPPGRTGRGHRLERRIPVQHRHPQRPDELPRPMAPGPRPARDELGSPTHLPQVRGNRPGPSREQPHRSRTTRPCRDRSHRTPLRRQDPRRTRRQEPPRSLRRTKRELINDQSNLAPRARTRWFRS